MKTPAFPDEAAERPRQILEEHGIRPTAQRLSVAAVLLAGPCHLSAEQILASLRRTSGRASKATVYNTLKLFVEHGLARPIHADGERCVYDSTTDAHHHFQNLDTGEMTDIRPGDVEFAKLPDLPPDTEIAGVDVIIRIRARA